MCDGRILYISLTPLTAGPLLHRDAIVAFAETLGKADEEGSSSHEHIQFPLLPVSKGFRLVLDKRLARLRHVFSSLD